MVESLQYFGDVCGHAEVYVSLVIIPVKSKTKITCAFPEEMVNVIVVDVFYAEVINNKAEPDWAPCVCPETGHESALAVSGALEAFFEELLDNDASLWQAIHSLLYLTENFAICVNNFL